MRIDGWESRLVAVIEAARTREYELGEHDCFRVACAAVEALTGVDHWKDWGGQYHTRREALLLIHEYGGGFTPAMSRLFGSEPVSMRFARRGDVAEYVDVEPHLGVCLGERVAMLAADGLRFVELLACRHAWRIG